jgi:hypothetical protein
MEFSFSLEDIMFRLNARDVFLWAIILTFAVFHKVMLQLKSSKLQLVLIIDICIGE